MVSAEVIQCKCVCKRNEGGECDCVCNAPCPGQAEGKVLDWTCDCSTKRGKNCVCKFKLRCTREEGGEAGKCCGGQAPETELYTCDCPCGSGECTFRVRKCVCCEIVRTGCGGCGAAGEAAAAPAQKPEGCCGGGGCCKN